MDTHNIDDYLDLSQEDSSANLVDDDAAANTSIDASEDLDWDPNSATTDTVSSASAHSVQASNNLLPTVSNSNNHNDAITAAAAAAAVAANAPWFAGLQGIDLSQIINNNGMIAPPVTITPDSLTRPPTPTAAQIQQQLQAARSLITATAPSQQQQQQQPQQQPQQEQQSGQEQTSDSFSNEQPSLSLGEAVRHDGVVELTSSVALQGTKSTNSAVAGTIETSTLSNGEPPVTEEKKDNGMIGVRASDADVSEVNAETSPLTASASEFKTATAISDNKAATSASPVSEETAAAASPASSATSNSTNKRSANRKASTTTNKKRKSRKKLYCICQKPYDGEPMVQCDKCKEWFHCECVGFDVDDTDDEDGEWICQECTEGEKGNQSITTTDFNSDTNSVNTTTSNTISPTTITISLPPPTAEATGTAAPINSSRQPRLGRSHQSKCLYAGCQNRTRADSFCSDVCARKHNEDLNSTTRSMRRHSSAANRIQSMAGVTAATTGESNKASKKKPTAATIDETGDSNDQSILEENDENDDEGVAVEQDDDKDEDVKMEDLVDEEEDDDTLDGEEEEEELKGDDEFEFEAGTTSSTKPTSNKKTKKRASTAEAKTAMANESNSKSANIKSRLNEKEGTSAALPSSAVDTSVQSASPEHNPIRRNAIKTMTNVLKPLFDVALEKNPEMFVTTPTDDTFNPAALDTTTEVKKGDRNILSSQERTEKLAKAIESAMFEQLGDKKGGRIQPGERYKSKYRSLLYNLKDKANQVFQLRVVTGDLSPDELVLMSSEDMANPELKSMSEVLRKAALKNSVMKIENMPIIKKTHKGDIIMLPNQKDQHETEESMYSKEVQEELQKISDAAKGTSAATASTGTEEGSGGGNTPVSSRSRSASYSQTPTPSDEKRFSFGDSAGAKVDPLDAILSRLGTGSGSSDNDGTPSFNQSTGLRPNKRSGSLLTSSTEEDLEAKKRKVNEDLEKILGDEDEDTPFVVEDIVPEDETANDDKMDVDEKADTQTQQLPTVWKGRVNMPQVAEFEASARQIGGRLLTEAEWEEVLSPNMWIEGRIRMESVTNYVTQTQYSNSREIVLIEVEADGGDENQAAQSLLHYLGSRKRYAVVGHNKTRIKDFYLIPLYKTQEIPDCLYVVRVEDRKKRPVDLFLGVLVLTKQKLQPHQQQPIPSLTNAAIATTTTVPLTSIDASTATATTTSLPPQTATSTAAPILPPELQFLQHLPQLAQLTSQQLAQPLAQQQSLQQPQPYTTPHGYQAVTAPPPETTNQSPYQPYYGYQANAPINNTGSGYQQYSRPPQRPPQQHQSRLRHNDNRRHHHHNSNNPNNSHHSNYRPYR